MSERRQSRRRSSRRAERKPKEEGETDRPRSKRLKERDQKKKKEEEEVQVNKNDNNGSDRSYTWLDSGVASSGNKQRHYKSLRMVMNGQTTIVAVGDAVRLAASADNHSMDEAFVAKVDKMWQEKSRKNDPIEYGMKIRARWYFKKSDVKDLSGKFSGPISKKRLLQDMTDRDLILSDQYDENDVLTILGKCAVVNRRPDDKTASSNRLSGGSFLSRYSIYFIDGAPVLTAYEGVNEPWPEPDDDESKEEEEANDSEATETIHTEEFDEQSKDSPSARKPPSDQRGKVDDPGGEDKSKQEVSSQDTTIQSGSTSKKEEGGKSASRKDRKRKSTPSLDMSEEESEKTCRRKEERKGSIIGMRTNREEFNSKDAQEPQDMSYLNDVLEDTFASDDDDDEGSETQFSFGAKWIASQESPTASL